MDVKLSFREIVSFAAIWSVKDHFLLCLSHDNSNAISNYDGKMQLSIAKKAIYRKVDDILFILQLRQLSNIYSKYEWVKFSIRFLSTNTSLSIRIMESGYKFKLSESGDDINFMIFRHWHL